MLYLVRWSEHHGKVFFFAHIYHHLCFDGAAARWFGRSFFCYSFFFVFPYFGSASGVVLLFFCNLWLNTLSFSLRVFCSNCWSVFFFCYTQQGFFDVCRAVCWFFISHAGTLLFFFDRRCFILYSRRSADSDDLSIDERCLWFSHSRLVFDIGANVFPPTQGNGTKCIITLNQFSFVFFPWSHSTRFPDLGDHFKLSVRSFLMPHQFRDWFRWICCMISSSGQLAPAFNT